MFLALQLPLLPLPPLMMIDRSIDAITRQRELHKLFLCVLNGSFFPVCLSTCCPSTGFCEHAKYFQVRQTNRAKIICPSRVGRLQARWPCPYMKVQDIERVHTYFHGSSVTNNSGSKTMPTPIRRLDTSRQTASQRQSLHLKPLMSNHEWLQVQR